MPLPPLGVRFASPREHSRRGGHITLCRGDFDVVNEELRRRGVVPDFRSPDGIRIGLSPLSTRFTEVHTGMATLAEVAAERLGKKGQDGNAPTDGGFRHRRRR
ncbi:kynureninase [Actinopolyspora lacussalsi subsp. righensis]|uniref:Kynureninase n=1 Tax=Actinopolyspora righensis TaxID=995060 RepID=A0A1I6X1W8_9ACTN|nr:kynureninase [Actinopolyspora righensis]